MLFTYLLFVDDVNACFDVRERVRGGQDGLAFELFVQVPVCPSIQSEGGAVDKTSQVVIFVKVSDPVLHFIRVKIRLHVRDLDEGLQKQRQLSLFIGYIS